MKGTSQIDFIGKGQSQGILANNVMSNGGMDAGKHRPFFAYSKKKKQWGAYMSVHVGNDGNGKPQFQTIQINADRATLRRDEWKALDEAVLKISDTRLVGINDLRTMGLTYNLGNGMGSTVLETHSMSDAMEAELSMDGKTRGRNDRVNYSTTYLPLPIIHVDYQINSRALAASRNMGNPLDTSNAERAARRVAEKLEAMLFTSTTHTFGNGTIYSYLNHPDRNQVSLASNWNASGDVGDAVRADVVAMKQAAINAKHFGPYMLYIPTNYETVMDEDYDATTPGTTIRERILKISGIQGVKVVDTLPDNNVVLVQMTPDVVRLVNGMGITNVEWNSEGGMLKNYKVMVIQVPQIRSDDEGNSGIVHLS